MITAAVTVPMLRCSSSCGACAWIRAVSSANSSFCSLVISLIVTFPLNVASELRRLGTGAGQGPNTRHALFGRAAAPPRLASRRAAREPTCWLLQWTRLASQANEAVALTGCCAGLSHAVGVCLSAPTAGDRVRRSRADAYEETIEVSLRPIPLCAASGA
jgi:hypothetical protein